MALQAHLQLPIAVERAGVDDGTTAALEVAGRHRVDVSLPGAVTALAVDALGQCAGKLRPGPVVADRVARIAVVARHAADVDDAAEVEVRGTVVSRTHRPLPAALGVPTEGQLHQPAVGRPVHERPGMVAGPDHVVGGHLEDVDLGPAGLDLMTALHQRRVARGDRVVAVGRGDGIPLPR